MPNVHGRTFDLVIKQRVPRQSGNLNSYPDAHMRQIDLDELPNPFSLDDKSSPARETAVRALKVVVIASVLLVAVSYSANWINQYRITSVQNNFQEMSEADKKSSLLELAKRGIDGLPIIVNALADESDEVAMKAYDILREQEGEWSVLPSKVSTENQTVLVNEIAKIAKRIPQERFSFVQRLIQRTIDDSLPQSSKGMRSLYFAANGSLQKLAANRVKEVVDLKPAPLPLAQTADESEWTDWPPPNTKKEANPNAAMPKVASESLTLPKASLIPSRPDFASHVSSADYVIDVPSVYRSTGSQLKTVPSNDPVLLHEVAVARIHDVDTTSTSIQETTFHQPEQTPTQPKELESTLQNATDQQVLDQLAKDDPILRNQASAELKRRGLSDEHIVVATGLVRGNTATKIQWLESIEESKIDVRPWLVMLLSDRNREVKLRTVSAIASLKDPWTLQQLQLHAVDEQDQAVMFRIRRVLKLR